MNRPAREPVSARHEDRGQILAIFALALIVMLALAGLALDGGSAFAFRRSQQTATDLAALAAANDYLINQSTTFAVERARLVAERNGFTHGVGGTSVNATFDTTNGIKIEITIDALHRNSVLSVVGMSTWGVSTRATSLAGFPDSAAAVSPFIFAASAFEDDGTPKYQTPTEFGEGNGDIPSGPQDLAWTNYGTGNVNTNDVRDMIEGDMTIDKTIQFGEYIGQENSGNHTDLFESVDEHMAGYDFPAAVVDSNGNFVGWTTFRVISATGSGKTITGYFVSSFQNARLSISACAANDCPRYLGTYVLKLID
jgi:hypothetical protein